MHTQYKTINCTLDFNQSFHVTLQVRRDQGMGVGRETEKYRQRGQKGGLVCDDAVECGRVCRKRIRRALDVPLTFFHFGWKKN
jgi:hypothetical protein